MRRRLARLLLALFFVGACADDEPAATTASTTTTSTSGGTSATAPERTTATSEPGRGSCGEPASSPATFDAKRGTYATYITKFDETTSTVSFDVVQNLSGEDAVEAYHKDNPDDPDGPPNDYYRVNESDRVRSARVSAEAQVWLVRLRTTSDVSLKPGSLEELPGYLAQGYPEDLYWLTMSGGSIVDICEQYTP